jgi:hypothetical protein
MFIALSFSQKDNIIIILFVVSVKNFQGRTREKSHNPHKKLLSKA